MIVCPHCKKEFEVQPWKIRRSAVHGHRIFCSKDCYHGFHYLTPEEKVARHRMYDKHYRERWPERARARRINHQR